MKLQLRDQIWALEQVEYNIEYKLWTDLLYALCGHERATFTNCAAFIFTFSDLNSAFFVDILDIVFFIG